MLSKNYGRTALAHVIIDLPSNPTLAHGGGYSITFSHPIGRMGDLRAGGGRGFAPKKRVQSKGYGKQTIPKRWVGWMGEMSGSLLVATV